MQESARDLTDGLFARVSRATETRVVTASASAAVEANAVEIRLLAIRPRPEPLSRDRADLLSLDYLIAVRMADALAEHLTIADIMFALIDDTDYELLDHSAATACSTLGLAIAPGCVVRGTVARARPVKAAPLVRFPLNAHVADLTTVRGTVLGPADTPVMGALVNIVGLEQSVRTGADGQFRLAAPIGQRRSICVRASARGFEAEATVVSGEPTIVTLAMES